ncbi:LysR family transcriptional regulator [Enterobacteriaceae bacterium H11S18]|uniref:LysR family transcriptional regulator n=1 Tax=Dryocola clanedunensis TaxID=2925396 RepID=UPI0022F0EBB6|nr:LysR family transcriptional regulator [Dryocola clanedunensis]MCT4712732.1 LysR family transcriptional regulator [Dryocola clanedunensis]
MMNHSVDLKELKVIHVLIECGSVTKTAEILDVSPGAVSYILNKVRKSTGSALFFRTKNGMVPDNIARELSQRYQSITKELFEEKSITTLEGRGVAISTYSWIELSLSFLFADKEKFPVPIKFSALNASDTERLVRLRNKEVDIDIGTRLPEDKSIIQVDFMSSDVCIIVSANHPTIKDEFTMKDWNDNHHIIWSRGMNLISNDFRHANHFNELINERKIACTSSNALNMIMVCAVSDHILLMPRAAVDFLKQILPIRTFDVPKELEMRFDCFLHYHHSLANDETIEDMLSKTFQTFRN